MPCGGIGGVPCCDLGGGGGTVTETALSGIGPGGGGGGDEPAKGSKFAMVMGVSHEKKI